MKTKTPQQGFGSIGIVMTIAVIAVLTGVGWTVWHRQHQNKQALSNTSSVSSKPTTTIQQSKQAAQTQQLEITEWGVKLDVGGISGTPTYKILVNSQDQRPSAFLSTNDLDNSKTCQKYYDPSSPSFQHIERYSEDEKVPVDPYLAPVSFTEAAKNMSSHFAFKVVGSYGYLFSYGNGYPCDGDSGQAVFNAYKASFDNLRPIK